MGNRFASVLLLAVLAAAVLAGESPVTAAAPLGARHHEKAGSFSYCPPKGWGIHPVANAQHLYALYLEPSFTCLISVQDEAFAGTLAQYDASVIAGLVKALPDFKELSHEAFTTASGLVGVHHVALLTLKGKALRYNFFILDGGNGRCYEMKSGVPADDAKWTDADFCASAASFQIDPAPAGSPATTKPAPPSR